MFSFRSLELFLQPGITISTNSFVSTRREIISHLNNRHDGCVLWKHWILYLNRFTGAIVKGLNGWAAKSPKLWTRDQVRVLFVHRNLKISDLRLKIEAGRSLQWSMCLLLFQHRLRFQSFTAWRSQIECLSLSSSECQFSHPRLAPSQPSNSLATRSLTTAKLSQTPFACIVCKQNSQHELKQHKKNYIYLFMFCVVHMNLFEWERNLSTVRKVFCFY